MLIRPLLIAVVLCATAAEARGERVGRVEVRGNHRVEPDVVRAHLITRAGAALDAPIVRSDIRALWKTGLFEDVRVESSRDDGGELIVTFVVSERPAIRKVMVSGNDELGLAKINEVLRLQRGAILDPAAVEADRGRVASLYADAGFSLAEVRWETHPVDEGSVDVWFVVRERAKVKVRQVDFIGNEAIGDDELRDAIGTRPGGALPIIGGDGVFREAELERDLARLIAFYRDRGYMQVSVGAPRVQLSKDKRSMYISIPIDEGPVFRLASIDVVGADTDAGGLKSKPGDVARLSVVAADLEGLVRRARDRGYAYANVVPRQQVDLDERTLALTFEVERGKQVYVERINIRGATKTRDKVIRRELAISEGELFSQTALDRSRRRVTALGYFGSVDVSTRKGSSAELIEVDVEVQERRADTFQVGFGFSTADNFMGQAQLAFSNLLGRGQALQVSALVSSERQLYNVRFVEPYFLDTDWTFAFDLFRQNRDLGPVDRSATGGALTWGRKLSDHTRAFVRYQYEEVGVSDPGVVANLYRGGSSSSVRTSVQYDTRDNRIFPTDGNLASAFVEVADRLTGSENEFVRYGGELRHYQRLWGPFVLKLNAEVGAVTSRDPLGVPITERYLLGGIHDIRGFGPASLGPRIEVLDGEQLRSMPLGGNLKVVWNSEIEFPLARELGISGVVFFDAGNAFNLEDRYCSGAETNPKFDPCFEFPGSLLSGMRSSVGFGFRWFSPIGPLRFEWGIPLDRQPGEDWIDFQFAIGGSF